MHIARQPKSILYVRLPCNPVYPGGVVSLADFVHKNYPSVRQRILDLARYEKSQRAAVLRRTIEEFEPDTVAFSWRDIQIFAPHEDDESIQNAFKFYHSPNPLDKISASLYGIRALFTYVTLQRENVGYIKQVGRWFPDKQLLVGGSAVSVFAKQIAPQCPVGTIAMVGEGEDFLAKLIEGKNLLDERVIIKTANGLVYGGRKGYVRVDTQDKPIDYLYVDRIFPQLREYFNGEEFVGVQTKRGCTQRCAFCVYKAIEGARMRYRPPKVIADEIALLQREFGVKKIWFTDAQFIPDLASVPIVEETLEEILARQVDIEWQGYIRIENLNPKLAKLMIDTGISIFELSLASGSQQIIDRMRFGFTMEQIWRGAQYIKDAGYTNQRVLINYSLNAPGETKETLLESINSYHRFTEIFGVENVTPFIFFLAIQPHTELERIAIEEGRIKKNYNPVTLNPFSIKRLIYNPEPWGPMLARLYLDSWKKGEESMTGRRMMLELERRLAAMPDPLPDSKPERRTDRLSA